MSNPFSAPDEYVKGFWEASQNFMRALAVPAAAPKAPASSLAEVQMKYLQQQAMLWMRTVSGAASGGAMEESLVEPDRGDRRFHGARWRESAIHSTLKQGYLLNSRYIGELVESIDVDDETRARLRFYARQFVDAMSPANFAATNPDVVDLAVETGGESLQAGFGNLLADLRKGGLTITDESAFEIGRDVAVSEGSVIYENDLFQLIQYAPLTVKVAARPLVIVPPCINKFYILDLQPENSFVRFAVEQGHTVFLVSWRNPDETCSHLRWDDYVEQGAMKALEVARDVGKADQVNALGWCVGGTILSSAVALLRGRGDQTVASLTLLTTMLDFCEPGDLGVFIDEQSVAAREMSIGRGGLYRGAELGFVFQALRANDLIWPNVINNYLKGKSPEAFDLLYWNSDTTNLPGPMYAWYLRNMYLENNLVVPGKLTVCDEPVDLGRIDMPCYVLATREDHIVPWRSAYRSTQWIGGQSQFVLGASGHIAGVINPAAKNRRSYWIGGEQGDDPARWLAGATEHPGSWWKHWIHWLALHAGKQVAAPRRRGNATYAPIEDAPGRYVKVRAQQGE